MSKRLIVNADDYGRTSLVSAGIRSAHMNGIVTSTTAMMNMPGIVKDLEAALQECPQLGLGVHLDLTAGKPISPVEKVRTLVDETGKFPSASGFMKMLPSIDLNEVHMEWESQIGKFIQVTGRNPDHLDSHHHTSYLTEDLFEMMLGMAEDLGCSIRRPTAEGEDVLPLDLPAEFRERSGQYLANLIASHSVSMPEWFFSSFFNESATLDRLLEIIGNLPQGTSEMMCHPGFLDNELEKSSSYAKQRDHERQILEDAAVRNMLSDMGVEMISFGDL